MSWLARKLVIRWSFLYPHKKNVFGTFWNQPVCPCVHLFVLLYRVLVCVKTMVGGIKSHLVTGLISFGLLVSKPTILGKTASEMIVGKGGNEGNNRMFSFSSNIF